MGTKINVSGPITKTFTTGANATITIGADAMTGATSGAAGAAGIVPAPAAGDQDSVLRGDGTWGPAPVTYSTTEQAIGTWIDGSTIYRKVYTGTWSASGNVSVTVVTDASVDSIIATGGWFDDGAAKVAFGQKHWLSNAGPDATSYAMVASAGLIIRLVNGGGGDIANRPYQIWVEYTK
jgi:hypothetical protein